MEGIHDMGGVEGYGRPTHVPNEEVNVGTRWEAISGAALFALLRSGVTNIDAHRHRIERLDPTRYLPLTYWGRWLAAVESAMVEQGVADVSEIEATIHAKGHDPADSAAPPRMHPVDGLESRSNQPGFLRDVDHQPRFAVGDLVTTLRHPPQPGHHRLPRYCRGRSGAIVRSYPAFTLPDTVAHGRGEHPTYLYAVAFAATELWGPEADPAQTCHLDLFETYLEPARTEPHVRADP
ncbi:MAG: nitrile hydratase subunit beta [Acidimicrobiia bacterium]|nr:nitrile hydratase subunit beta [Acidimicrobiia bacterium]